ncbi:GbsR/MarR family transcriptional regulator [Nocardia sp. NPDC003482]|uniref:GbsR/MarR family transcriptional regulator n=1 Tax=Nocardia sp. NPDC004068 TaxID=3364303 RepID=UPI003687E095
MATSGQPDTEEQREFVERLAGAMTSTGVPPMAARVLARVLISDAGVMTSAELAAALEVSQPSISSAVRFLTQTGFLTRERVPGTRKERYRVRGNVWETILTLRNDFLAAWQSQLASGADLFGEDTATGRRLAEAADFFAFAQQDIHDLIQRWRDRQRRMYGATD